DNVGNCDGSRKRSAVVTPKGPMAADWTTAVRSRDRSSRQKCRVAGCRVGELLHRGAVEVFEPLAGEHGADGPFRDAFPRPHDAGTVGGAQRVVRIVGGEEGAVTRAGERADFAHDFALVAEVEVRGRL